MWKVGDKIRFIKEGTHDSRVSFNLTLGKTYTVVMISKVGEKIHADEHGVHYGIEKDNGCSWWIEYSSFKLVKKEIENENDWLDAIQENFKEGV